MGSQCLGVWLGILTLAARPAVGARAAGRGELGEHALTPKRLGVLWLEGGDNTGKVIFVRGNT